MFQRSWFQNFKAGIGWVLGHWTKPTYMCCYCAAYLPCKGLASGEPCRFLRPGSGSQVGSARSAQRPAPASLRCHPPKGLPSSHSQRSCGWPGREQVTRSAPASSAGLRGDHPSHSQAGQLAQSHALAQPARFSLGLRVAGLAWQLRKSWTCCAVLQQRQTSHLEGTELAGRVNLLAAALTGHRPRGAPHYLMVVNPAKPKI